MPSPDRARPRRRLAAPLAAAVAVSALGLTACIDRDPTTGRPPPVGTAVPAYTSSITTVTAASLGSSWRAGCPVGPADLRAVKVAHWDYAGVRRTGTLIVHRTVAADVAGVFRRLYERRFQVRQIHPVQGFGSDDGRSMDANNTSAFNCRRVTGGTSWSEHSYGTAIDINPIQNPYVKGSLVLPEKGRPYLDRTLQIPGFVRPGGVVDTAFRDIGWSWGGRWTSLKDYQHFSLRNR